MKKQEPQAGGVYFSPAICKHLEADPPFMYELIRDAEAVIAKRGQPAGDLIDSNTDAYKTGSGLAWYHLTSTHGRIYLADDPKTGNLYTTTAPEYPKIDTLIFAELETLSQYPQNAQKRPTRGFNLFKR